MRIALLLIFVLALLAAPAQASPRQVMTFEAPAELFDDSRRDATLDEIRGFGVTRIRHLVYWQSFAPDANRKRKPRFDATDPAEYPVGPWAQLDRLVAAAQARGIDLILTPTGPVPRWATKSKKGNLDRPSAQEFGRFVTALARRYGEQVSMWSVWNEPNQPQFLMPQYRKGRPYSPRVYRNLYRAAHRAIRSVGSNRRDTILIGETSPRGNDNIVHPLRFLREMACLNGKYRKTRDCARLDADGYAHHAYTTRVGPRFEPAHRDDVTIGVLDRLVGALDKAGRARALPRGLKIYLTEFGIQSQPDRISGVSFARQPAYYAVAEHMAYVNPRVALFSQYLMRDDAPRERGLSLPRVRERPAAQRRAPQARLPRVPQPAGGRALRGDRRAVGADPPAGGRDRVTIEARRAGSSRWRRLRTLKTTTRGVYGLRATHRKGQAYRVRWTSAAGKAHTGPPIRVYDLRS